MKSVPEEHANQDEGAGNVRSARAPRNGPDEANKRDANGRTKSVSHLLPCQPPRNRTPEPTNRRINHHKTAASNSATSIKKCWHFSLSKV